MFDFEHCLSQRNSHSTSISTYSNVPSRCFHHFYRKWFLSCMNFMWLVHNECHNTNTIKNEFASLTTTNAHTIHSTNRRCKCSIVDNQQLCLCAQQHTNGTQLWIVYTEGVLPSTYNITKSKARTARWKSSNVLSYPYKSALYCIALVSSVRDLQPITTLRHLIRSLNRVKNWLNSDNIKNIAPKREDS